jgi:hypothetical protein
VRITELSPELQAALEPLLAAIDTRGLASESSEGEDCG